MRYGEIDAALARWFDLKAGVISIAPNEFWKPKDKVQRHVPISREFGEFLRDYGRHFTINRMLSFDSVKLRLEREHLAQDPAQIADRHLLAGEPTQHVPDERRSQLLDRVEDGHREHLHQPTERRVHRPCREQVA